MRILKSYRSSGHEDITTFVNDNNILQEDIVTITRSDSFSDAVSLVIFFYADSEVKVKTRNFWGEIKS